MQANGKDGSTNETDRIVRARRFDQPLLRSGLALAGANPGVGGERQADGSNGILTALEVLSLDL